MLLYYELHYYNINNIFNHIELKIKITHAHIISRRRFAVDMLACLRNVI